VVERGLVAGLTLPVDALALDLPADATAPRLARAAVSEALGDHPRRDDLLLCVSEVVTNAVLHARSASQLRVRPVGDGLVVEVTDHDPRPPIRRQHDLQAPTGRGLHLLDALTTSWGTSPHEDGKVVWFEFDLATSGTLLGATGPVQLLGLPVAIHRRAGEHHETLRRELELLQLAQHLEGPAARLQALGEELAERYGGLNAASDEALASALADPAATAVDLRYDLPRSAVADVERMAELLDELDRYCAERDLLTLVTPSEGLAYRHWFLGELVEQLRDGRAPRPWSSALLGASATAPPVSSEPGPEVVVVVHGDLDLEQATTLREELLEHIDGGATHLVVDLADCPFLDSTGISLLITTQMRLAAEGGDLRVTNAGHGVLAVLDLSGLSDLLT
jgi:anti-anti-sigma factor